MDIDEERDFADQGPLTDIDMEEDAEILSRLLKQMPSCIDAADIEQLVQDIPVQPPVVVPVRTIQEAVAAGDLPPLDRQNGASRTSFLAHHQLGWIGDCCGCAQLYYGMPGQHHAASWSTHAL